MADHPLITFKGGICDIDTSTNPPSVKARSTPGYIYLYEDELVHFCWRPRTALATQPEVDLVMIPPDATFKPYKAPEGSDPATRKAAATNGRIAVLRFAGSSERKLFWLQSKSQSPSGDPSYFSPRDLKLISLVDDLLQGSDVDVNQAIQGIQSMGSSGADGDETMEDVEGVGGPSEHHQGGSGGAGPGATGGDIREEGSESREGGADGGRAAPATTNDTTAIVQNFLDSLRGGQGGMSAAAAPPSKPFTTLPDLLPSSITFETIESATDADVDALLSWLPPILPTLVAEDGKPSLAQKKDMLRKVLRSPQFNMSLGSLTVALRDGGLPSISDALGISVKNGGFMRRGGVPLGGGEAVEAFLDGVKAKALGGEEDAGEGEERMETD